MSVGLAQAMGLQFTQDWKLAVRSRSDWANPMIFFVLVITLLPLGIGPEVKQLAAIAPGMIWIVALLATLLSLDAMFRSDWDDGSLEQMLISPHPLPMLVLSKIAVHWLVTGLPLTLLSPLLGLMLSLPEAGYLPLIVSLFIGSACLSFIGAIGAALTVALRQGGLLISLIIMPFYVPVLIFGASAAMRAVQGFEYHGLLVMLGGFLALAVAGAPFAVAAALRISSEG
ncbi:heme exporter protein CcmB [Simiduia aestuariiviva]|uniref:Heme exporter protein B n=1 Tax=Simiduia aestuariiviva TaxID=1510459 RepID=A0A839UQE6_9GAMM|nr:heme exporter protein CcmB [Simiduia aestuariiviva]MBB3168699.1 heme exporter protein B [Simiduia aestuariiviva]